MKLTVQHGHVIFEVVMPPTYGRVSSSQYTAMILRGGVFFTINIRILLHLTPDHFNNAMKPLILEDSLLQP